MFLVNRDPLNMLNTFHNQLNRLAHSDRLFTYNEDDNQSYWRPAVDIKEEKERFLIFVDVPGVNPKDIEITMENGTLTVKGKRYTQTENDDEAYKRVERTSGEFCRQFSLPDTADSEHIEARGSNGILEISIPKYEKVKPRRIEVKM